MDSQTLAAVLAAPKTHVRVIPVPIREPGTGEVPALPVNLEALERWAIPEALKRTGGNKTQAAEMLGITRETLANKLKRFGMAGRDDG